MFGDITAVQSQKILYRHGRNNKKTDFCLLLCSLDSKDINRFIEIKTIMYEWVLYVLFPAVYCGTLFSAYVFASSFSGKEMSTIVWLLLYVAGLFVSLIPAWYFFAHLMYLTYPPDHAIFKIEYGQWHPKRVFRMFKAQWEYFSLIRFWKVVAQCGDFHRACLQKSTGACDLSRKSSDELDEQTIATVISQQSKKAFESIRIKEQKIEREVVQGHYKELVIHEPDKGQRSATEMICIMNVHYSKKHPKEVLHLFLPPREPIQNSDEMYLAPCIVFIPGGGWSRPRPEFSSSIGATFTNRNIAVVVPTYAGFPDGMIEDMCANIEETMQWIVRFHQVLQIHPLKINIVAHSAGANIAAIAMIEAIRRNLSWLDHINYFVGLAGCYDIADHLKHECHRGVDSLSSMARAMHGVEHFEKYSPTWLLNQWHNAKHRLAADGRASDGKNHSNWARKASLSMSSLFGDSSLSFYVFYVKKMNFFPPPHLSLVVVLLPLKPITNKAKKKKKKTKL
ncbi:hypothetical protein RFI_29970 [Reticulomyxa filosa]|uniref:BD-FAE-like domain-containing protein n=1 Tax=Reticulomyxa filosa TaxID=46433 RepID=X6M1Z5_RETFI|nr:hypothetical protein RFI_29970 [Reticulomyxa filosa]|eukprot:ETO07422.1 hypothetical protein RFI_29970 [Reticulomyxa filosa]